MKPHPRMRKTVKWVGPLLTVLLIVGSIGSGWLAPEWIDTKGSQYGIWAGRVYYMQRANTGFRPGFNWFNEKIGPGYHWAWWFYADNTLLWGWRICIPLWAPALASLVATMLAWRFDLIARRRDRAHLCRGCNYDRTGLPAGAVCPECGAGPVGG